MTGTATYSIDRDSSPLELKQRLRSFAREIGFDFCRIAACSSPPHAHEFRNWLHDEAHGEMSYMERGEEKRFDPQKILPGARSIIVLGLNYFQGGTAHPPSVAAATFFGACPVSSRAKTGRIARYARGDDYHELIARKLDKVDEFL